MARDASRDFSMLLKFLTAKRPSHEEGLANCSRVKLGVRLIADPSRCGMLWEGHCFVGSLSRFAC
jgi:hypothetical protein